MTTRSRLGQRTRGDQGTALLLLPAAVLIVAVLGVLAVDSTADALVRRALADAAATAAQDALTLATDPDILDATGAAAVRAELIPTLVERSLAAQRTGATTCALDAGCGRWAVTALTPGPDPAPRLSVETCARTTPVFGAAVGRAGRTVCATGTATLTVQD